ncbi:gamma-glutamylcyclotransferase [Niastella caeni]|uniref:Gamma-glutamylcyclotransferase n=1 Tax=Niastella caeni TaxID=2569763 RepID=A0A4S8HQQ0_9BACT|nr:gamma-glutamylcyclotransferase family protein [Niastella caeni]THU37201.1 gamma-glutamylcyclotransferase [Niastella caeni]
MQLEIYRLFVYGSLRSGFHNSAYNYISRYFIFDGMGSVQGKLYDMGEYPGAIPCTEDYYITGELYHIAQENEFAWAMEQLDDYEGILVEPGETPLFRRELVNVLFRNTTVTAWMYWYNRLVTNQPSIESGDYVAYRLGIGK